MRAISLWHLDELYGRLITVNSNWRVIKDPCLHKALNFCYNHCYVQRVDSLQKISVQLCRQRYPISIKLGKEKYIWNRFPIVPVYIIQVWFTLYSNYTNTHTQNSTTHTHKQFLCKMLKKCTRGVKIWAFTARYLMFVYKY